MKKTKRFFLVMLGTIGLTAFLVFCSPVSLSTLDYWNMVLIVLLCFLVVSKMIDWLLS